jgi:hypothetical protein
VTLPLTVLSATEVPLDGGYLVSVYGTFDLGNRYNVHIGPNGDATDPIALSGVSGSPHTIAPATDDRIDFYTPVLVAGLSSVYVFELDTSDDNVLTDSITVVEPVYRQTVFDIRRVLPINYRLGPREMARLHQPGTTKVFPVGLLEAVTSAIGDADNNIGGLFETRLTSAVSTGAVSLPVESTYGFLETGKVGLQGIVYRYASKTQTSFDSIQYLSNGLLVAGTAKDHRVESVVIDVSQIQSAVDLLRRSMLVEYAEGEFLNALGRNVGVNRLPFLKSDDVFREIIKHLAYNPRGTIYGIELALTGLVGAGNFEVYEDVIRNPCTVFIALTGSATTEDFPYGKAFLETPELQPSTGSQTVDIDAEPVDRGTVASVRLKDEDHTTETKTQKPSAEVIEEYPGDPGTNLWSYNGANEATEVLVQTADSGCIEFPTANQSFYAHRVRILQESEASVGIFFKVLSGTTLDATPKWGLQLEDSAKAIAVGIAHVSAGIINVGFANLTTGTFLGSPTLMTKNAYHDIEVVKDGTNRLILYLDGIEVERVPYTLFPNSIQRRLVFGALAALTNPVSTRIRSVRFFVHTRTNFWNEYGASGSVNLANPTRFDTNSGFIQPGDVGKQLIISGSVILNPQGGNNNGDWIIDSFVDTDNVELTGRDQVNALLQTAFPTRVVVPTTGQQFKYPDDLGKKIVISGSGLGNDGSYTITDLLDSSTFASLGAGASPIPATTNVCVCSSATFVNETGLDWKTEPVFFTETGLDWELSEAGARSGTTLTMRSTSILHPTVLAVRYSRLLSAQILRDNTIDNQVTQEIPTLEYAYYPFYLSDPLGFVRGYLDDVTAAGVIPDYEIV